MAEPVEAMVGERKIKKIKKISPFREGEKIF